MCTQNLSLKSMPTAGVPLRNRYAEHRPWFPQKEPRTSQPVRQPTARHLRTSSSGNAAECTPLEFSGRLEILPDVFFPFQMISREVIFRPLREQKQHLVSSPGAIMRRGLRDGTVGATRRSGQRSVHPLSIIAKAYPPWNPNCRFAGNTQTTCVHRASVKPPSPILAVVSNRLALPRVVRIP